MRVIWADQAWDDYTYWFSQDRTKVRRVNALIASIRSDGPATGIGKPEALRANWSGWFSRRIDEEHRLVYRVAGGDLEVAKARYHYGTS